MARAKALHCKRTRTVTPNLIDAEGKRFCLPADLNCPSHSKSECRGVNRNMQAEWTGCPYYQLELRATPEEYALPLSTVVYLEALKGGTTCRMDSVPFMHRCADAAGEIGCA